MSDVYSLNMQAFIPCTDFSAKDEHHDTDEHRGNSLRTDVLSVCLATSDIIRKMKQLAELPLCDQYFSHQCAAHAQQNMTTRQPEHSQNICRGKSMMYQPVRARYGVYSAERKYQTHPVPRALCRVDTLCKTATACSACSWCLTPNAGQDSIDMGKGGIRPGHWLYVNKNCTRDRGFAGAEGC